MPVCQKYFRHHIQKLNFAILLRSNVDDWWCSLHRLFDYISNDSLQLSLGRILGTLGLIIKKV